MLYLLSAIALTALLAPLLTRFLGQRAAWLLMLAPLASFVWFVSQMHLVAEGGTVMQSVEWIPALGINLSLRPKRGMDSGTGH